MDLLGLTWRNPFTWRKLPPALWAKIHPWGQFVLIAAALWVSWRWVLPWLYSVPRTGFGDDAWYKSDALEYRRSKTLWDWLQLLVVPAFLALAGYAFAHWKDKSDRKHETDRLREDVLQGYLDRTAELMLDKDVRGSSEDAPVRAVARSRTLLALRRLDGRRKGYLLRFLHESRLITREKRPLGEHEVVPIRYPYQWVRAIIRLDKADLRRAVLADTDLSLADFQNADLRGAVLEKSVVAGADLGWAWLDGAKLHRIKAESFKVAGWQATDPPYPPANFKGAILEGADLSRAYFYGADLSGTSLRGADLRGATLQQADLRRANLTDADLRGADLSESKNLTQEQVNSARGDATTKLPGNLTQPVSWGSLKTP